MNDKPRKSIFKKPGSCNFKIIVLGDSGVGKTCLINRYVSGFYIDSYTATLGIDFKVKRIEREGDSLNLQIWDTAGQERFKTITKSYFQGCAGVLLLFSLTNIDSFKSIEKWLSQLDDHVDKGLGKILVGTKVDSPDQREVEVHDCSSMALEHDLEYFEASSKTGYNIDAIFESMIDKLNQRKTGRRIPSSKVVRLKESSKIPKLFSQCEC